MARPCTLHMHVNNFVKWKVDSKVKEEVEKTCFRSFLSITDHVKDVMKMKQNKKLIEALLSCYQQEDEVFIFGGQVVLLTLEDMYYITGLQIDGFQVSGYESSNIIQVCKDHFNIDDVRAAELINFKNQLSMNKLRENFQTVPEGVAIEPYVKAYLLYLLGNLIFTSSTHDSVSPMYLPFLSREKVNTYAWGAAALSYLKCSISLFFSKNRNFIHGFSYAPIVFVLERVQKIRGVLCIASVPSNYPLHLDWIPFTIKKFKNTKSKQILEVFKQILTDLEDGDIEQKSYDRLKDLIPEYEKKYLWTRFCKVPCLCFNTITYNRLDLVTKQLGISGTIKRVKKWKHFEVVHQNKEKDKNWREVKPYRLANSMWRNRDELLIVETDICTDFLMDDVIELRHKDGFLVSQNVQDVAGELPDVQHNINVLHIRKLTSNILHILAY